VIIELGHILFIPLYMVVRSLVVILQLDFFDRNPTGKALINQLNAEVGLIFASFVKNVRLLVHHAVLLKYLPARFGSKIRLRMRNRKMRDV
jgi:hypothetical protein